MTLKIRKKDMSKLIKLAGSSFIALVISVATFGAAAAFAQTTVVPGTPAVTPGASINVFPNVGIGRSGIFNNGFTDNNLSNLALLDTLFTGNNVLSSRSLDLGNLVLLNSALNNSNVNSNNFASLFALGRIFGGNNNSIFNDSGTSLGDVLILDQLFNGNPSGVGF